MEALDRVFSYAAKLWRIFSRFSLFTLNARYPQIDLADTLRTSLGYKVKVNKGRFNSPLFTFTF